MYNRFVAVSQDHPEYPAIYDSKTGLYARTFQSSTAVSGAERLNGGENGLIERLLWSK